MGELLDGKYEVLSLLREGGMGSILKVRHVLLEETRVVKMMKPQLEDETELKRRFYQEARLATTLRHANIVTFYDFFETPSKSFGLVMEFIEGWNLSELLAKNGPSPISIAIEVSLQILEALDYLHRKGIVHRDISPENVMVSPGEHGRIVAKLIDLGIAKNQDNEGLTRSGMFLGKLKYCSPEQIGALKKGQTIDGRSDVYSFGCVLYTLLTGQLAVDGDTMQSFIVGHIHRPPRSFDETDKEGRVPANLRRVVLKALAKRREDRWANALQFADQLRLVRDELLSQEGEPDEKTEVIENSILVNGHFLTSTGSLRRAPKSAPLPAPPTGSRTAQHPEREAPPTAAPGKARAHETPPSGSAQSTSSGRCSPPLPVADALPTSHLAGQVNHVGERSASTRGTFQPVWVGAGSVVVVLIVAAVALTTLRRPATPPKAPPVPAGFLLITASPWGSVMSVSRTADHARVSVRDVTTPARIALEPGTYTIVLRGPGMEHEGEISVQTTVSSQTPTQLHVTLPGFDVEELIRGYAK